MAYITLAERPQGLLSRFGFWYSRRRVGTVMDPIRAAAGHAGVLLAMGAIEWAAEWSWKRLDPRLRMVALQVASEQVGCSWCIDFGRWESAQHYADLRLPRGPAKGSVAELDEQERLVAEYAEAATTTPGSVSQNLVDRLRQTLGDAEIVELGAWVALENYRSRFNSAMGLTSQGFSQSCEVPASSGSS